MDEMFRLIPEEEFAREKCGEELTVSDPPFNTVVHVCGLEGEHTAHRCRKKGCGTVWGRVEEH